MLGHNDQQTDDLVPQYSRHVDPKAPHPDCPGEDEEQCAQRGQRPDVLYDSSPNELEHCWPLAFDLLLLQGR